jgi:hypothetical protein
MIVFYVVAKAGHESTRGSPGPIPAGISSSDIHTWIYTGLFPQVTVTRRSKLAGIYRSTGTCTYTGHNKYLQVYL